MNTRTAWERMEVIREKNRPTINDYIPLLFDEYFEMHGDRLFGDDGAITGGVASFCGRPVTVIAQVKGRNLNENKACNFAMAHPEGYRKALRLARQAEKFHRARSAVSALRNGVRVRRLPAICTSSPG